MDIQKAFKLLDEYNNPKMSDGRLDRIVVQLYKAGYVIRPLKTIIIKNEVESEVLNADKGKEWGLVDRSTGRPVTRPDSEQKASGPAGK